MRYMILLLAVAACAPYCPAVTIPAVPAPIVLPYGWHPCEQDDPQCQYQRDFIPAFRAQQEWLGDHQ